MVEKYGAVNFMTNISKTTSRFLFAPRLSGSNLQGASHVSRRPPTVIIVLVGNPFPSQLSGRLFGNCFIKDANPW
jgi:hypothetical protein